jgi:hypothetical protein
MPEGLVYVRATINLTGFRAGTTRLVDPSHPTVAALIQASFLVVLETPEESNDAAGAE